VRRREDEDEGCRERSAEVLDAAPPEELRACPGYLLRRVYARFSAEKAPEGPPAREFVVLDALAEHDARSQRDLAERLGINRTIMVRLIDRLEEAGLVRRMRNPANRRSHVLSLTEAGRAALAGMREAVAERDARLTAALTPGERRRLAELLSRLLPEPERPAIRSVEYLVAQAHLRMRRVGDAMLSDVGLRIRHYGPLSALERLGPCPQQRLARHLAITEPAAAEVVDELVRAGLVARGQDADDRRRYALELTELGRERLTRVREAVERLRGMVVDALGAEGEAELRALLLRLLPREEGAPAA